MKFDVGVTPKALPSRLRSPVSLRFRGAVSDFIASHPPALREMLIDLDRNIAIDSEGLPACPRRAIAGKSARAARQACRPAAVGSGRLQVPIFDARVHEAPAAAFNGGTRDGKTTVFLHADLPRADGGPVTIPIRFSETSKGRYGLTSVWTIPPIAEGKGAITQFDFKLGRRFAVDSRQRSLFAARCTDDKVHVSLLKAELVREAGKPRTKSTLTSQVLRPCERTTATSSLTGP